MDGDIGLVKAPRLCDMTREESGYGFNLHGEKGVIGQYISAVDPGGPADMSGMCIGDRVIEVNGENVENLSHADVVARIRARVGITTLLVIDKITDNYLQKIGRPVTADLVSYSSVHEIPISDDNNSDDAAVETESEISKLNLDNEESVSNGLDNTEFAPLHNGTRLPVEDEIKPVEQAVVNSPNKSAVTVHPVKAPRPSKPNSYDSPVPSPDHNKPVKPPRASPKDSPQTTPKKPERPARPTTSPPSSPPEQPQIEIGKSNVGNFLLTSPIKARPQSIPKRKQVKQTKSDWKSKQSYFDQL